MDEREEKGVCSLLTRRKNNELVYFQTDKSGKMSADTVSNFTEKMGPHLVNCEQVDFDEVDRIQEVNNSKAKCWMRIVGAVFFTL